MPDLNDLINDANDKLKRQEEVDAKEALKKAAMEEQAEIDYDPEDIYAGLDIDDDDGPYDNPVPAIQYNPPSNNAQYAIQHDPIAEEEVFIEEDPVPAFEGGPSIGQVDVWKKQFTKEKIFHTQILEKHFVFRTLNRYEYKQIIALENIDALYREEIICNTCVLWPRNYDFRMMAENDAGYPSTLAQIIMENSGFTKEYGIEIL